MTKWRKTYQLQIARKLARIQRRRGRPYAVVTDVPTGKFVQLVGSKTDPLTLLLPSLQILSDQEMQAARKLLGEPKTVRMGPRSDKSYIVFQGGPFDDAAQAAAGALDVMDKVFRAAGNDLTVDLPGQLPEGA